MAPAILARLVRQKSLFDLDKTKSRLDLEKEKEQSRMIDKAIKLEQKRLEKEIKVLLLGAADSGKSTIIKQMRIINSGGFEDGERRAWKKIIFRNLVDAFLHLFKVMDSQDTELQNSNNVNYLELLSQRREIGLHDRLPPEYFDCFQDLWEDDGIHLALLKAQESILSDNLGYFLGDLDRFFEANYLPTDQDILYAKSRTIGVVETVFEVDGWTYRMVDVGGQRSERKKWIRAFDSVSAVIFVASISAYDQCIAEDPSMSQTEEALVLFKDISNLSAFKKAALVLFLNKIDLLSWKLQNGISPIRKCYPDYTADPGAPDRVQTAQNYFAEKFKRLYKDTDKKLYIHFTHATDSNFIKGTMKSVQILILQHNLSSIIL